MNTSYLSILIVLTTIISPLPLSAQPSWTEFAYTDWSPDSTAAVAGVRAYDSATVWDGERFVTFFQGTYGEPYLTAASDNGQDWSYLNGGSPISVSNLFSHGMGNHTVACEPDGFPDGDVMWTAQSENVRFKMWYADTSTGEYFQYAESTGGINWYAFSEGVYCPPYYKIDPNQYMTKPSVIYRPDGSTDLSTDNPMDNRYLMYLNGSADLDPYYFELYISSNGLDWTLYAWDNYCESRFSSETIFEEVTFSDYTGEPDYVDTFEEVFTNGERDGWILWTHNGDAGPIASWYSANGYDWVFREEPINEIGDMSEGTGYWNENANINLDSVRLGNNYFFLRSGSTDTPSEKYQLGAGIRKSRTSVEVTTPFNPQTEGDVYIHYKLYSWNEQTLPTAFHEYKLPFFGWTTAQEKDGPHQPDINVGKKFNLATSIGGYPHTFVWDTVYEGFIHYYNGQFRVIMGTTAATDEHAATGTFDVYNAPTPLPPGYKTPSPTPSAPPTPSTTPTPQPTSTTSPTPEGYKSPTPTPTPTLSPTPSLTPIPTVSPTSTVTPTPSVTPTISATPTPSVTPTPDYCADPLQISDLEGLRLAQTRATVSDGWYYQVVKADSLSEVYGEIYDNANSFSDQSSYPVYPAALRITRVNKDFNIQTGDYIELTYDSLQTIYVYPPPLSGNIDVYYYIGLDGSTYNDLELCNAAKTVPTPTATPEGYKTPTPSPSSTSTPTPSPTRTPTPTPTSTPSPTSSPTPSPKKTPPPTPTPIKTPPPSPSPASNAPPWIYDYDGDGTSDIGIFRGSSGLWAIRGVTRVYFGTSTDETVPGDYDGDGTTNIGIFRPSSGLWALRGVSRIYFGGSSDDLVQGDYDGSGTWSVGIFRSAAGLWAIRGITRIYFGGSSDEPVPGYYAGGLSRKIGIFRPASGLWAIRGATRIYFGGSSDETVPGDYDGNGTWSAGIFRPTSGLWAIRNTTRAYFGGSSDDTIPGDYAGTGNDEIGIFRPASGLWAIRRTSRVYFGSSIDIPVSR